MPKSLIRLLSFWWCLTGAMGIDFLSQLPVITANFHIYSHVIATNPIHTVQVILPKY